MADQTWNQYTIKNRNKQLVLNTILKNKCLSRADIATKTGLNKGTVSSQVNELLQEELIYEQGPGESSGGRRPVMLLFNQTAGYSIGIDIGVNYILGVLTDLEGNVHLEKSVSLHQLGYDYVMSNLYEVIDHLIEHTPDSRYHITGIGIGVPGTVSKTGEILLAPNLKWKNVSIKEDLEERYHCPILIENEANAGAYGELKFGYGKNHEDIIYVSVGVGIGIGMILNGKLYSGNNGFAGEMGHMTIHYDGPSCNCGNRGCWELYASEQFLEREMKDAGLSGGSLEDVLERASGNDMPSIQMFQTLGDYLGTGLINIINTFNPNQIVIGNRITLAKQWIEQPLLQKVKSNTLWFQQDDLKISFSDLAFRSTALGASAFAYEKFLKANLQTSASQAK
ncbi:ROK family transcriptional regulator [Salimicrobium halophilum]|uniref:Sugar kinase of the NBD/HSP70 family, may contain an N-terminal HTH domain n=1 Tax=Salimicrobium halophilum TaxID=86666 RepID=A0A1G8S7Y9_9BACI|nr:ROK family transcriptional regulator [Salimicrobium halophilum]SDJ25281.1 Sugar kinase of the NBD/HSP70 family, may contain an N-terminal HTH domain [Salimicrobium halophilum]